MKRFCDSVRFERNAQGTTVVLTKTWQPGTNPAPKEKQEHEKLHPFSQD
jgi:hypothetical protein